MIIEIIIIHHLNQEKTLVNRKKRVTYSGDPAEILKITCIADLLKWSYGAVFGYAITGISEKYASGSQH
jgi:hypothetical protein